jgi:hypothetical protein
MNLVRRDEFVAGVTGLLLSGKAAVHPGEFDERTPSHLLVREAGYIDADVRSQRGGRRSATKHRGRTLIAGVPGSEVVSGNRLLAAREGMDPRLVDPEARCLIPVREMLDGLLADSHQQAVALGCAGALDRVKRLAASNRVDRQHEFVARDGRLDQLVASLADQFCAPDWRARRLAIPPRERSGLCAAGSRTQDLPF